MTAAFLEFFKSRGNDLSTPMPELGFPGLKPGDRWCLCAPRWQEAFEAGQAPRVVLHAAHEGALSYCSLADLKRFATTSPDSNACCRVPLPGRARRAGWPAAQRCFGLKSRSSGAGWSFRVGIKWPSSLTK
jgi:hypothetical protein